jgi:hypothetical protein
MSAPPLISFCCSDIAAALFLSSQPQSPVVLLSGPSSRLMEAALLALSRRSFAPSGPVLAVLFPIFQRLFAQPSLPTGKSQQRTFCFFSSCEFICLLLMTTCLCPFVLPMFLRCLLCLMSGWVGNNREWSGMT